MSSDRAEVIARQMALADRPDWAGNAEFWESYLPQARMWLAANSVNARLEGGDVD